MKKNHYSVFLKVAVLSLVLYGCDIEQTKEGKLPDIELKGMPELEVKEEGQLPEFDVEVPDVDVKMKETTIKVPDVDIEMPSDAEEPEEAQ